MAERTHSLLLIEDNLVDEALTLKAVSECGVPCDVKVVRKGDDPLGLLLSSSGPPPELVVLEFHREGHSAIDLLRELRSLETTKVLPIVMLTAADSGQELSASLNEGANSYVRKPIDPQEYIERVALIVRYWLTVDKRPDKAPPTRQAYLATP